MAASLPKGSCSDISGWPKGSLCQLGSASKVSFHGLNSLCLEFGEGNIAEKTSEELPSEVWTGKPLQSACLCRDSGDSEEAVLSLRLHFGSVLHQADVKCGQGMEQSSGGVGQGVEQPH